MTSYDVTPEHELASRYLDGDVTSDERARVEESADLLALVASMRHVATLIAAVSTPPDSVREAALASALAEFEGTSEHRAPAVSGPAVSGPAVSGPAVSGPVVSLADRRRWPAKVLSAAAAVMLLGVVGAVGMNFLRDSASDRAESTRQSEPKLESRTAEDSVGGAPEPAVADEVLIAMEAPVEIDDPQDLLLLMPPEAPTDGDAGTTAGTTPGTTPTAAAGEGSERYNSYNLEALACMTADQIFLADIYFQGMLAIAVRDTVTGVTEAIDSTCTVLARVAP